MQRALSGGWNSWRENAAVSKSAADSIRRGLLRMMVRHLTDAFNKWHDATVEAFVAHQHLSSALNMMTTRDLRRAWNSWIQIGAERSAFAMLGNIKACSNFFDLLQVQLSSDSMCSTLVSQHTQEATITLLHWRNNMLLSGQLKLGVCLHLLHGVHCCRLAIQAHIKCWHLQSSTSWKCQNGVASNRETLGHSVRQVFSDALSELQISRVSSPESTPIKARFHFWVYQVLQSRLPIINECIKSFPSSSSQVCRLIFRY